MSPRSMAIPTSADTTLFEADLMLAACLEWAPLKYRSRDQLTVVADQ